MHAASNFISDPGRALAFSFFFAGLALSAFFWLTENWHRLRARRDEADELARGLRERLNGLRGNGPFAEGNPPEIRLPELSRPDHSPVPPAPCD